MTTRKYYLLIPLVILIFAVLWYFLLLPINIREHWTWLYVCAIVVAIYFVVLLFRFILATISEEKAESNFKKFIIICVVALIIYVIGHLTSFNLFRAEDYRNLANVQSGNFEQDFPEADPTGSNIPFVSMEIAQQLGDRTIANVENAEYYEVDDEYNLIEYQGDYYRISSLSYGNIVKYFSASANGIPGYVLVNVRTQQAKFCKVDGGYFYSPSSLLFQNLRRHLRMKYPTTIFDQKDYFEIDEEGHPYWITPTITKTIGLFGGDKVENIIITDAVTGDSEMYDVESLPKWVDHAMLLSYLKQKATDYYEFIHGSLNLSDKDVKKISNGYNSFINEKGEVCFTMGLTPANEAKSNIGFILINSRTGEIKEYMVDGIQEETAQSRVETLVQNYGYHATSPLVVNIEGVPTYLMCLTGDDGLIQDIALACISTTSNATAYATTLKEAITKYKALLNNSGAIDPSRQAESVSVEGVIKDIFNADIEGTTYFFYVLEENDKLFKASISINEKQVLAKAGMTVKLTYTNEDDIISVESIELE